MGSPTSERQKLETKQKSALDRGILAEFHHLEDPQVATKLFGKRTAPEMLMVAIEPGEDKTSSGGDPKELSLLKKKPKPPQQEEKLSQNFSLSA